MADLRPILIAGPTASGKSGLALRLAEQLNGVVINADSMQVYRELRVLTARPSPEDEARVPHALYGFVSGTESYSAGRYATDVAQVLEAATREGRRPIVVGGTGLYFKALTEGLSPIPAIPDDIRAQWRSVAAEDGAAHLHGELAKRDPVMAQRLASGDTQRVVRALEVLDATGMSLAEWQRLPRQPVLDIGATIPLLVAVEREELACRIDTRFREMVHTGGLQEAMQLEALELDPALPLMTALGVRPLLAHLAGEASLEDAIAAGQMETRQYAKRQVTWARSNMIAWRSVSAQEMQQLATDFVSFIQRAH
jgi:tRNA dimethylallyltransferase